MSNGPSFPKRGIPPFCKSREGEIYFPASAQLPDSVRARSPRPYGTQNFYMPYDVIVIGAGLAGLMAADAAQSRGARVLILARGMGSLPLIY